MDRIDAGTNADALSSPSSPSSAPSAHDSDCYVFCACLSFSSSDGDPTTWTTEKGIATLSGMLNVNVSASRDLDGYSPLSSTFIYIVKHDNLRTCAGQENERRNHAA